MTLSRAREPRLSPSALARLRRALRRAPRNAGHTSERWTRTRIAALIERRFNQRVSLAYAGRLARRLRGRGLGPSRERRLTLAQAQRLRRLLLPKRGRTGRSALTRGEIAQLIEHHCGIRYHRQSIPRLLRRWRIPYHCAPPPVGDARPSAEQRRALTAALGRAPTASGILATRWEQRHIATFLHLHFGLTYPARGLYRRLSRWGLCVPQRATAGGTSAMTPAQRRELSAMIGLPPPAAGYATSRWTRALVARVILDRFDVSYAPASIPHLLRTLNVRLRPSCPSPPGPVLVASATAELGAPVSTTR